MDSMAKSNFVIDINGNAYAYGDNNYGQLGIGLESTNESRLKKVIGDIKWKMFAASQLHTIGLSQDGLLYGSGYGSNSGIWSVNRNTFQLIPTRNRYINIIPTAHGFIGITKDGLAYGFGNNAYGDLGTTYTAAYTRETLILVPHQLKKIVSGYQCVCALDTNNNLYWWGTIPGYKKVLVPTLATEIKMKDISASQAIYAISVDGDYYAMGLADSGRVGNGTNTTNGYLTTFTKIGDKKWQKISALMNSCIAIDDKGELYGWGDNRNGELALGNTRVQLTPQLIDDNYTFTDIAGSKYSFMATTIDNRKMMHSEIIFFHETDMIALNRPFIYDNNYKFLLRTANKIFTIDKAMTPLLETELTTDLFIQRGFDMQTNINTARRRKKDVFHCENGKFVITKPNINNISIY